MDPLLILNSVRDRENERSKNHIQTEGGHSGFKMEISEKEVASIRQAYESIIDSMVELVVSEFLADGRWKETTIRSELDLARKKLLMDLSASLTMVPKSLYSATYVRGQFRKELESNLLLARGMLLGKKKPIWKRIGASLFCLAMSPVYAIIGFGEGVKYSFTNDDSEPETLLKQSALALPRGIASAGMAVYFSLKRSMKGDWVTWDYYVMPTKGDGRV
jgi:hypothetical protein